MADSKIIRNLAHPNQPKITRSDNDANVCELLAKVGNALDKLKELDASENNSLESARSVWDWIFKSDGFFKEFDEATSVQKNAAYVERSLFDVPWREAPPWPMAIRFEVTLRGKFGNSEHGSQWEDFESNSPPAI